MRVTIAGYQPDLPSDTPGLLKTSANVVPTARGIKAGWATPTTSRGTQGDLGTGTLTGAYQARVPDGTYYYYIGMAAKLWEATTGGGSVTDRSGATYNSTATNAGQWSFSQFGTKTLAVNKFDTLQVATTGSSSFAAVSGAPKASIVVTVGEPTAPFAMVFNYDDGTDTPDGIFWSALGDYTDWTPDSSTQCGNVRILEDAGPFTAAIRYRDGVLAWKENSMYLGTYVGSPDFWSWQRIASGVGCSGKYMCVLAGDVVYFADRRGLWRFDGSYPQLIAGGVQNYWANTNWALLQNSTDPPGQMSWDPIGQTLYVNGAAATLTWNAISGLWLKGSIGGLFVLALRPKDASNVAYVVNKDGSTNHYFVTSVSENGSTTPSITMGFIGDPIAYGQCVRIAPVWLWTGDGADSPTNGGATPKATVAYWKSMPDDLDGLSTTGAQSSATDVAIDSSGRYFDVALQGNFQSVLIKNFSQSCEFRDIVLTAKPDGSA